MDDQGYIICFGQIFQNLFIFDRVSLMEIDVASVYSIKLLKCNDRGRPY